MDIKEYVISEWENYKEKEYIRDKDILEDWEKWRKKINDNNIQPYELDMKKPDAPENKDFLKDEEKKMKVVCSYMCKKFWQNTLGYFILYDSLPIFGKGQFSYGFGFAAEIEVQKVYDKVKNEYHDYFNEEGIIEDEKKDEELINIIKENIVYREKKDGEHVEDSKLYDSLKNIKTLLEVENLKEEEKVKNELINFEKDNRIKEYCRRKILFLESARGKYPKELRYLLPSIKNIDQKLKKIMKTDNIEDNWVLQGKTIIEGVYKLINEGITEDKEGKTEAKKVEESLENTRKISEMLWNLKRNLKLDKKFKDIESEVHKQVIYTGAPGTGKTYGIKNYIRNYCVFNPLDKKIVTKLENGGKKIKHYEFVQFHSSYDYSDFVEGLRPVQIKEDQPPTFVRMDGIFKEFCRNVVAYNKEAKNTDSNWFFIIDEINRADIGKVFGELMYCLEEDYRGKNNAVSTQYKNLPTYIRNNDINAEAKFIPIEEDVFENGFYIPENVHIIGSMNDIDRSVETFDFALRRRFLWKEIKAYEDEKSLAVLLSRMNEQTDIKESMETLAKAIINMNKIISGESGDGVNGSYFQLNESYQIGAAYFKKYNGKRSERDKGGGASLDQIWEKKIEPTLREYVRGYDKTKVDEFIKNCKQALLPKEGKENKNSEKANSADADGASEEQDLENAEENDEE